jgi:hypothetical protein
MDLVQRFVPYMILKRGADSETPGPYTKLPPAGPASCSIRHLALNAVATLLLYEPQSFQRNEVVILKESTDKAVSGGPEQVYWQHIVSC